MSDKTRCSKSVFSQGWHHSQCSRWAVAEENGQWYCKQHLPSAEKRKQAESRSKREIDMATSGYRRLIDPWHRTLKDVKEAYPAWTSLAANLSLWIEQAECAAEERLAKKILDIKTTWGTS